MQENTKRFAVISGIIFLAAISRLIPHPLNFAPLGAMALFGAAYFGNRGLGLLITMISWLISDLVLNNLVYPQSQGFVLFTDSAFSIYLSIAIIYFLGAKLLSKLSLTRMFVGSISASMIFFVLSNFGVWTQGMIYPLTSAGLAECYLQALPFLKNTLLGDLTYSGILFLLYDRVLKSQLIPNKIER